MKGGGSATASVHRRKKSSLPQKVILKFLWDLSRPYRKDLVMAMIVACIAVGFQAAPVALTRTLIDVLVHPENTAGYFFHGISPIIWIGAAMAILATLGFLAQAGIGALTGRAGSALTADLRARLHTHALSLPIGYHARTPTGAISSKILQDTMALERFLIEQVPFLLVNIVTFLGVGGVLFFYDPWLGLIALAPVPLLALGARVLQTRRYALVKEYFALNDRMATDVHESLAGIKPIKASCRETLRADRFGNLSAESGDVERRTNLLSAVFSGGTAWLMALGTVGVWWLGAARTGDKVSVGTVVAAAGLARMFYGPLQFLTQILHQWVGATAAAGRVAEFLSETPEHHANVNSTYKGEVSGDIEFENVRFSYIPGTEVLKSLTFRIEPGETIGLVGHSGAGKTTLTNLVFRFYDPDSGAIRIDGRNLNEYDLATYRRRVGVVLQEPFLFRASVLDNIRFARPEATREEVMEAAEKAQALQFIEKMSQGFDTPLGDEGTRISIGETQRIAIARAILQDPAILILDEATSNLDTQTEQKIQEALSVLLEGRTTIAIAHRLGTLRIANRLFVLNEGCLAEIGTHEELMKKENGIYSGLVHAQSDRLRHEAERNVWKMERD